MPTTWALVTPPYRFWPGVRLAGALLVVGVAVWASRRAPLVSLTLVVLATLLDGNIVFAIPVLGYLVGRRMERVAPAALVFVGIALGGTALNLGVLGVGAEQWYLLATTLVFGGVLPWLVGRYRRQRWALVLANREQAELAERERRGAVERIRMRERARIAQDIHDSLGHELSLIALRAGALELAPDLAERHRRAAGEVRASVALATERLRQVIGVLRDDAEPAPTRPVGEGIADLVARSRAAGMSIRLLTGPDPAPRPGSRTAGPADPATSPATAVMGGGSAPTGPAGAADGSAPAESRAEVAAGVSVGLPPLVERAAYRVVQEALTNANRHAPGAAVTVRLDSTAGRTVVRVTNDPPPVGPVPDLRTTGSGLVALAEWVRTAGGTLRAGPAAGGFEVVAELPHTPLRTPVDDDDILLAPLPSASVERLDRARRRVRRSLVAAVAVPALVAVGLTLAYYPIATFGSVLPAERFERMRLGQSRAELRDALPRRQLTAPAPTGTTPTPPGASCEYYPDAGFPMGRVVYRLCFVDGRLAVKERLPG
ncbi:two-component sensor histidine kinase [Micromonospora sp. HM5-17]|nr:two-component sensor histidine kinase [Micromonospora sp. HM5-17]